MNKLLKPSIAISPDAVINVAISPVTNTERCTIIHCRYADGLPTLLRIWPTTYLVQENGERKKLLHAFNISAYPEWTIIYSSHTFTLLFEGLDAGCKTFDLLEDIPEAGGFHIKSIERNTSDVYKVDI